MKKLLFYFLLMCLATIVTAQNYLQTKTYYTSVQGGLNLRAAPSVDAASLGVIGYGDSVKYFTNPSATDENKITIDPKIDTASYLSNGIIIEGITAHWLKVVWKGKIGYVVDLYLLPIPPPKKGTKSFKEYFTQLSKLYTKPLNRKIPGSDIDGFAEVLQRFVYNNGFVLSTYTGYEWYNESAHLVNLTVLEAYQVIRNLADYDVFFANGGKLKAGKNKYAPLDNNNGNTDVEWEVVIDEGSQWVQKIQISTSQGAYYEMVIQHNGFETIVAFSTGV